MLKIDLHIHSQYSGHAYGSFYDIVDEARRKKMKMIAITDHGPAMKGSATFMHFGMGFRAPKYKDIKVLWGCESNILNANGDIDLDSELQKKLDILLIGLHHNCGYEDLGLKGNTAAVIKAISNPNVDIFTHPTNPQYEYDYEKVFQAALDNDVMLELNLSYLAKNMSDEKRKTLLKKMIDMARKAGKKVIVNSDAHFLHEIGDDSILKKYWKVLGLTDDIIINNYPDELMKFLEKKK
jgi:putative hydrolase